MTRSLLKRPLLSVVAVLTVISGTGAGYSVTTHDPASASEQVDRPTDVDIAAADYSTARDSSRRYAGHAESLQRAADEQAHADYLVWLEEEKARKAAEKAAAAAAAAEAAAAEAAAEEQAARDAEDARADEEASRSAVRDPRSAAQAMLGDHGWSSDQFGCLESLWEKESNWDPNAANPTSSAYGIPQALPGSKMSSAGSDWETNPITQISWGLGYIEDRYGSPCSAWSHSQSNNWY